MTAPTPGPAGSTPRDTDPARPGPVPDRTRWVDRATAERRLGAALDAIPFRRVHVLIVVLVALGALFDAIEQYNVGLAAPLIAAHFALSKAQVGLLTTVTFAGMAVGSLVAGVTGDRYGRRVTYMYNLVLYTLGALLAAFAPGFGWLLAARVIVGIGLGGELNTGLTLVAELMPTRVRGAAVACVNVAAGGLGIFASSALAAVVIGPLEPLLGGPETSWRWLLGVLALPAVLVFFYRWLLPESPRYLLLEGRVREANAVLDRLAANRLRPRARVGDDPGGAPGPPSPAGGPADRLGVDEGRRFFRRRVRLSEILAGRLGRHTAVIWTVSAMTFGAQVTVTSFMPTVLVTRGLDVSTSLAYTTVINVGGLAGAVLAAVFGSRLRRRIVLGYGAMVAVAVATAFGFSMSTAAVLALGGLLQLMFMLLNTTTWVWAPELYPTHVRALGTGASVTVALISASVLPLLAGTIFDAAGAVGIFVLVASLYATMAVTVRFGPETLGTALDATPAELGPRSDRPAGRRGHRSSPVGRTGGASRSRSWSPAASLSSRQDVAPSR